MTEQERVQLINLSRKLASEIRAQADRETKPQDAERKRERAQNVEDVIKYSLREVPARQP